MRRTVPALLAVSLLLALLFLLLLPWSLFLVPGVRPPPPAALQPTPHSAAVPAPRALPAPAPVAPAATHGAAPPPPEEKAPEGDFRIHGRVVAVGAAGVPDAEIEVRAWSGDEPNVRWTILKAVSGPSGEFSVKTDRALASLGFGIETSVEGYLEGWVALKPEEYDPERGVEVPVEPARCVTGRAVDEYGRPVPKVTVQMWYGSETTWPTAAGPDGRFKTPARGPRRAFDLIVEADGFARRVLPLPAAPSEESTDVGDVVFRRGGKLAGVVTDTSGRPVAGLVLELSGISGSLHPRVKSDEAGRFEFADLGEGTVGIFVGSPGSIELPDGNRRCYNGGLGNVAVGRIDLKVVVNAETTVVLRFRDAATGEPVTVTKSSVGSWVTGAEEPANPFGGSTSSSSPYGKERFTTASGGKRDFIVRSPGFEDARITGVEIPDVPEMTVDVPLRRSR